MVGYTAAFNLFGMLHHLWWIVANFIFITVCCIFFPFDRNMSPRCRKVELTDTSKHSFFIEKFNQAVEAFHVCLPWWQKLTYSIPYFDNSVSVSSLELYAIIWKYILQFCFNSIENNTTRIKTSQYRPCNYQTEPDFRCALLAMTKNISRWHIHFTKFSEDIWALLKDYISN